MSFFTSLPQLSPPGAPAAHPAAALLVDVLSPLQRAGPGRHSIEMLEDGPPQAVTGGQLFLWWLD